MSYIYAETKGDDVIVWERNEKGRVEKIYPAPFYFYVQDDAGKYESIYNEPLKKYEFKTRKEFTSKKSEFQSSGVKIYESDIAPELKILTTKYYNKPTPNLNISFFDIEVDFSEKLGFSSVSNPYAPINAVSFYHAWKNEYVLIAVPPDDTWTEKRLLSELKKLDDRYGPLYGDNPEFILLWCQDEKELLLNFINEIEDSDVISGYNNEFFDDPMLGKRIELVLGKKYLDKMSFPGARKPRWTEVDRMGRKETCLDIFGRISADYLKLIRKYEVVERQSYKLESVAEDKLPNLPKLSYEGSLARQYREDFAFFCRYNLRDVEILHGFENQMKYVALGNEMYHMSCGLFPSVFTTLKLSDLSIINHCHYVLNKMVPDAEENHGTETIQGAHVLDPVIGMHEWVGAVDVNSLYPSSIRSNNISPETLIGQFEKTEDAHKSVIAETDEILTLVIHSDGSKVKKSAKDWKKILKKNKWSISGYGSVYDQNFEGVIPAVLKDWFNMRNVHKKKMNEYEQKIKEIKAKYI